MRRRPPPLHPYGNHPDHARFGRTSDGPFHSPDGYRAPSRSVRERDGSDHDGVVLAVGFVRVVTFGQFLQRAVELAAQPVGLMGGEMDDAVFEQEWVLFFGAVRREVGS